MGSTSLNATTILTKHESTHLFVCRCILGLSYLMCERWLNGKLGSQLLLYIARTRWFNYPPPMTRGTALLYPDGQHIPTWTASLLHVPSILARVNTIHVRRHRLRLFFFFLAYPIILTHRSRQKNLPVAMRWRLTPKFHLSATFASSSTPQNPDKG